MKAYVLPILIALSALSISASAAFYSVYGLSKLFAGASTEVIVMASGLEASKLVLASLLYQYWSKLALWLKTYLTSALLVLMVITSAGIYGFLSGAYQETATLSDINSQRVAILEAKQDRFIEQRNELVLQVKDLTQALSNPGNVQYVDRETGLLVTTTSRSQRLLLQGELKESKQLLASVRDSVSTYDVLILEQSLSDDSARELGPLKYISQLAGTEMDSVINWFMLLIIFVFDPLAISLVIAANIAFEKPKPTTKPAIEPEFDWESAEKRMNIVGQNGNDGVHYEQQEANLGEFLERQADRDEALEAWSEDIARNWVRSFRTPIRKLSEYAKWRKETKK